MSAQSSHRVTIVDVARAAHVSAGTVSNALTGKRPVAEETRTRILQAIADLRYQPNLLARGLVNQRTQTVGIVAAGLEYYGPSRTLIGIDQEANALGYALLLDLLHSPYESHVDSILNLLSARRVDGIIWAVHEMSDNHSLDCARADQSSTADLVFDHAAPSRGRGYQHRQLSRRRKLLRNI